MAACSGKMREGHALSRGSSAASDLQHKVGCGGPNSELDDIDAHP